MKILLIHKFFYRRRGAESILFDTIELLEKHGHETIVFSMQHPKNLPSKYEKYFISHVQTQDLGLKSILKLFRSFYSFEAKRNLEKLIRDTKPDVAHLHNIYHQISPSILSVLKKYQIPIILTAHDYKLVCPSYHLNPRGTKCPKNIFWHALKCVWKRDYKDSVLGSLGVALEWLFYKVLRVYERSVDMVLAPSLYVYKNFIDYGWPKDKIKILPNFTDIAPIETEKPIGDYVLYVGALSFEKGTGLLIETIKALPQVKFVVVGEGSLPLPVLPNLTVVGPKSRDELLDLYRNAALLYLPSIVPESFGLVVLEAALQKLPAVASNLGAIPEIIEDNKTGRLFDPNAVNAAGVASEIILELLSDRSRLDRMGELAFQKSLHLLSESHYKNLHEIYWVFSQKKV